MVHIPKIKRNNKYQAHVDRPIVITGNFNLQYEDVIKHNKYIIIAVFATGLLAVASFIPTAVYQSTADSQRITVEVENGTVSNPAQLTVVKGDSTSGGDSYIEFGPRK